MYYLLDSQDELMNQIAFVDYNLFYRELNEPATVDNLRYFSDAKTRFTVRAKQGNVQRGIELLDKALKI